MITITLEDITIREESAVPTLSITFQVEGPTNITSRLLIFSYDLWTFQPQMKHRIFLGYRTVGHPTSIPNPVSSMFELSHMKINAIDKERIKDVYLGATVYGTYATIFGSRAGGGEDVKYETFSQDIRPKRIAESDWVEWLKKWGKDIQEIMVPGEVLRNIDQITEVRGRDYGETLTRLLVSYGLMKKTLDDIRTAAPAEFIFTEPTKKLVKERVTAMLERVQPNEEIRITGYFGSPFLDTIFKLIEKGFTIKLITRPGLDKESRDSTKRLASQNREFVKVHDTLHARLLIIGNREAIISSADLKSDSIDTNFEAGVWTTNPIVISDAIQFFDKMWKEAGPWSG